MKHLIRNILIIIFYLTTIPFWRRLLLNKPLLRVWCLHEVTDNQVSQFENKIKYLKEQYHIITPRKFMERELSKDKINMLLTFDDGSESWFKNVLPILKKYQIKAIFFINDDFYHSTEQLSANGHSLGGHGQTHQRLIKLVKEELEKEVWQSVKSKFFAYPFGDRDSYNHQVIDEIKKAGFSYGFTILPGFNTKETDPYLLHRDSLDADVPDLIFKLWLKGCYDFK